MEGTFEKVPSKPPSKLSTHFLKVRTYGSECGKQKIHLPSIVAHPQKARRVFCGLFNICLSTPPIGHKAALLWRAERVRFCKRCLGGDLSPLISRCRDSFPPRGSLFKIPFGFIQQERNAGIWEAVHFCNSIASRNFVCYVRTTERRLPHGEKKTASSLSRQLPPRGSLFKIPFGFIQQERNAGIWKAVYICNSNATRNFVCYVRTTERRLPLGWEENCKQFVATATDEGDKSAPTKGIHSPCASHPPIGREAAPCKKSAPPQPTKNFPQEHPRQTSETNFRHARVGALGGSSGRMREVWREKEHPPKGGSFSLQGLPLTPTQKRPCRVGSIDPFRQSAFRDCRAQ